MFKNLANKNTVLAKNIEKNVYDGNTLPYALSQFKKLTDTHWSE